MDGWLRQLLPRGYAGLSRPWMQRFICNCCTILPCLGVAVAVPGESGTVLSVTGATGVAMCSYILPVAFHFLLFFSKARCQRLAPAPGGAPSARDIEALPGMPPPPADGTEDGAADLSVHKGAVELGSPLSLDGAASGKLEPALGAPPGLMHTYRKPRKYAAWTLGYDVVFPLMVVALGLFFSISTLVLLFQPAGEE